MRKLSWILLTGLLAICNAADAVVVQRVLLKNGSELRGYIKQMNLGGGFVIATETATVSFSGDEVTITGQETFPECNLDEAWVKWAEENDAFDGREGGRTLTLHDVQTKGGKTISRVKILEMGATVRYVELTKNEYEIDGSDVLAIRADKRSRNALSGIDRIYQLTDGDQYEGQYAGETHSTLSLYLSDGIAHTFGKLDVVKYSYIAINPNQTLYEQSPLLDIIVTRGGAETRGVIVEENYTSDDGDYYILLQDETGKKHNFKLADIDKVRKEENPAYDPKYDIVLKEGEVMVNREAVEYCGITETDDYFCLDTPGQILSIQRGKDNATALTVEYREVGYQEESMFQLIKASGMSVSATSDFKFSFKDLVGFAYTPGNVEISLNHTTKVEYVVDGEGVFILYDADKSRAIPVIVE